MNSGFYIENIINIFYFNLKRFYILTYFGNVFMKNITKHENHISQIQNFKKQKIRHHESDD